MRRVNSAFTLATCAATNLRAAATSGEWNSRAHENVSQLVAEHVSSVNGSVEQHGEYKFSNLLLNLLSNMWLV